MIIGKVCIYIKVIWLSMARGPMGCLIVML